MQIIKKEEEEENIERNILKRMFKNKKNVKEMLAVNEDIFTILKDVFIKHYGKEKNK